MAGFSFGNTTTPSGQPGFATSTSAFGNQPQQSPPTFGRSFSEAGGFQSMSQQQQQQQQQQQPTSESSAPASTSTGFSFGSKSSFSFPPAAPSSSFSFGSGQPNTASQQPPAFSFGSAAPATESSTSTSSSSQPAFSFGGQSASFGSFKPSSTFGSGATMDEDAMDKDDSPAAKPADVDSSASTFASTAASTSGFSFPSSSSTASGFTFPAKETSSTGFSFPTAAGGSTSSFSFSATSQSEASTTTAATAATTTASPAAATTGFSFGKPADAAQTTVTSTPAFSFGKPSAASAPSSFGTAAASQEPEHESTKAPATGGFKLPAVVPASAEEATSPEPEKKDAETAAPKFSFGAAPAPAPKTTPSFNFGSGFQTQPKDTPSEEADEVKVKKEPIKKEKGEAAAADDEAATKKVADKEMPSKDASSDSTDTKSSGFFFGSSSSKSSGDPSAAPSIAIPATPTFSIAATASSPKKGTEAIDKETSAFVFSMSAPDLTKPKEKPASPFSFGLPAAEPKQPATSTATSSAAAPSTAPQPGSAFTFGTATTPDKPTASTTPGPSPFSFGAPPPQSSSESSSTPSESGKKRKSSEHTSTAESSRQKLLHGKSPLSQSWSAEEGSNKTPTLVTGLSGAIPTRKRSVDSAGMVQPAATAPEKKVLTDVQNKENRPAEKHVSFKLPESKGKSVDKPEPVSPFKPLQSKPIEIPASQAPLSAIKSQSTSSDVIGSPAASQSEQTVVDSKITNPESIEKRTRYRDLPGDAQNELNLLYQFIEGQMSISKKIETRQLAHNGELLSDVEGYTDRCTKELRLHNQTLGVTKENLQELAANADYQVQNAMVAQLFFDNTSAHGRSKTGTTIHQRYFADLANTLNQRCGNYRAAINQLEERVDTMMRGNVDAATPDNIPLIIQKQSQTLMGLTAKVSDLHQEVEKLSGFEAHGLGRQAN